MISSRYATKEEILLVHSDDFYELMKSTKTATKLELDKLFGGPRSIDYTNVIHFVFIFY